MCISKPNSPTFSSFITNDFMAFDKWTCKYTDAANEMTKFYRSYVKNQHTNWIANPDFTVAMLSKLILPISITFTNRSSIKTNQDKIKTLGKIWVKDTTMLNTRKKFYFQFSSLIRKANILENKTKKFYITIPLMELVIIINRA